MIGPGVVVDPSVLLGEIAEMGTDGRTYVDANCGIIEDIHKTEDGGARLKEKIGSTRFWNRSGQCGTGNENFAASRRVRSAQKIHN